MGIAANKDIPPMRGLIFIPDKLCITVEVVKKDTVLGPIMRKHPEIFGGNELINEAATVAVYLV